MGTLKIMHSWQPDQKVKAGQVAYAVGVMLALIPLFVLLIQYTLGVSLTKWVVELFITTLVLVSQFHFRFKRTTAPMRSMLAQKLPTDDSAESYSKRLVSYRIDAVILGILSGLVVAGTNWYLETATTRELRALLIVFAVSFVIATVISYFLGLFVGEGMIVERENGEEVDRQQKWALRAHASQMEDAMVREQQREARLAAREAEIARRERELTEREQGNTPDA